MKLPKNSFRRGIKNPIEAYRWLSSFALEKISTKMREPKYLFSQEWDLAVILDACRYDLGVEASSNHSIPKPEKVFSPAWTSSVWMKRTFENSSSKQLQNTAYITSNQYSADEAPQQELCVCDEVWRYAWDEELGTVPPRPVTDRTIKLARDEVAERYLVHYMQPHLPPIDHSYSWSRGINVEDNQWREGSPWNRVKDGELEPEEVEEAYRNNINPVIEDVLLLLKNIDAEKVIITSDHGNFLGEDGKWGHYGLYYRHSAVRDVPWWELTATDQRTHEPNTYEEDKSVSQEELLKALGYK